MKKTVKGLIIAASVAAVVGVGAVSYAAWTGSGTTTASQAGNTTGSVSVIGFGSADGTLGKVEKLMPWDQPSDKMNSGTPLADYKLPTVESGAVGYKITVTADKGTWTGALYVIIDENATVATVEDPTPETGTSDWKAIDGTNSVFEFTATNGTPKQLYAHVILDSDNAVDMNKSYDLTFTLAEKVA